MLSPNVSRNYTRKIADKQNIGKDLDAERQLLLTDQFQFTCLEFPEEERRNFLFKWTQVKSANEDFFKEWSVTVLGADPGFPRVGALPQKGGR